MKPTSRLGDDASQLETPAVRVDLDLLEANIRTVAERIASRGKVWRPRVDGHGIPNIARRQIRAGAIGVTCATLSGAEAMAADGIRDILIANVPVGRPKLERLAALHHSADPIVVCDHFAQLEPLAALCRESRNSCRVMLAVETGANGFGVRPGRDTVELALAASRLEGIELVGLTTDESHLHGTADATRKSRLIRETAGILLHCRDRLRDQGLACGIVSAGGTVSDEDFADCAGITELQNGEVFGVADERGPAFAIELRPALTVLATVISRPTLERAVLDVGYSCCGDDRVWGVKGFPDAEIIGWSAVHCRLRLGLESRDLRIGDRVELLPGNPGFSPPRCDQWWGSRNGRLEVVWSIPRR